MVKPNNYDMDIHIVLCLAGFPSKYEAHLYAITHLFLAFGEVIQWARVFVTKPEDPSPIPGTHMVKENQFLQLALWLFPCGLWCVHMCVLSHKQKYKLHLSNSAM